MSHAQRSRLALTTIIALLVTVAGLFFATLTLGSHSEPGRDRCAATPSPRETVDGPKVDTTPSHAAANFTREVRPAAPTLRVLNRTTGAPLADVHCTLSAGDGLIRRRSGAQGQVSLHAISSLATHARTKLEVRHRGFVTLSGLITIADLEAGGTITLAPAGAVRIEFRDERGQPAPDLEACLLAPLPEPDAWDHNWRAQHRALQRSPAPSARWLRQGDHLTCPMPRPSSPQAQSKAPGQLHFVGLVPSADYRWGHLGQRVLEMEPAYEVPLLSTGPRGLKVDSEHAADLSGRFAVNPGATTHIVVTVPRAGQIHGRIDCTGASSAPQIKLDRSDVFRQGEHSMHSFTTKRVTSAQRDGGFAFDGVAPGAIVVRAWWRIGDNVLATCAREFDLPPGATIDLGTLAPRTGEDLRVRLGIEDPAGQPVAKDAVFQSQGEHAGQAVLNIQAIPHSRVIQDTLTQTMGLEVGKRYVLRGIPSDSRLHLQVQVAPWSQTQPQLIDLRMSPMLDLDMRAGLTVEPRLIARLGTAHRFRFYTSNGHGLPGAMLWVRTSRGPWRATNPTQLPDRTGRTTLALPADAAEILVRAEKNGTGYVARMIPPRPTAETPVLLEPGVTVQGTLRDSGGDPVPNRVLLWNPKGAPPDSEWMFGTRTDAQGRFTARGLIPGIELVGKLPGTGLARLPAALAGRMTQRDLTIGVSSPGRARAGRSTR